MQLRSVIQSSVEIDAATPIQHLQTDPDVSRVSCDVVYNGHRVGPLELPVFNGFVSKYVLEDAIAGEYAWPILGLYFDRHIYSGLQRNIKDGERTWIRKGFTLARSRDDLDRSEFHDRAGWTVFLQELWNRRCWDLNRFYLVNMEDEAGETWPDEVSQITEIEVSQEPVETVLVSATTQFLVTVGGSTLGVFHFPIAQRRLSADALISIITTIGGFELCRTVVREALVGRSLEGGTIRERLAESWRHRRSRPQIFSEKNPSILPFGHAELSEAAPDHASTLFVTRYRAPLGTSTSRRAHLPTEAVEELARCSELSKSHVVQSGSAPGPSFVVYAPGLIATSKTENKPTSSRRSASRLCSDQFLFGRAHWEGLFARAPDPWRHGNSYEQQKYEQTLSLVPQGIANALELACAEGSFTEKLALLVGHLVASDISQMAVDRTAQRCSGNANVEFKRIDFLQDKLPKKLDLIVCSEVLYYVGSTENLTAVARKIEGALNSGGYFLTAHANQVIDNPEEPGFNWDVPFGAAGIGAVVQKATKLSLQKEIRTPLHRIQLYRKDQVVAKTPEIVVKELPHPLPEHIAGMVQWTPSGRPTIAQKKSITSRLPILTYHRVSPTGSSALAQYRLAPEQFEEQIAYLQKTGYYSTTLDAWRKAVEAKRPLPGRALILTFDDGYQDFAEFAWPVLKRYGFSAVVFLVGSQIGRVNEWDRAEQELPLLTAAEILQLAKGGVEFGSHSWSHQSMVTLSPIEVVREHLTSRCAIEQILGHAVRSVSYPYGANDRIVQHLAGACGYVYGVTTRNAACRLQDPLLALPRIEITAQDNFEHFVAKLTHEG